jgi:hypothetical protein
MNTILLLLALAAHAGPLTPSQLKGFPNTLGETHFFTWQGPSARTMTQIPSSCREQIAKTVCLVEPMKEGEDFQDRPCLPGGEKYAAPFEALYDHYPAVLQAMFCSLEKIYVEKQFFGTAYAGLNENKDAAIMGIRQSVLDENLDLSRWASWKEQLSFGGPKDSYGQLPNLPAIASANHLATNDFLYFVVAHEFGHMFDFANDLNRTKNCNSETWECEMEAEGWGSFSWHTSRKAKGPNEFSLRPSLCFYSCETPLAQQQVAEAYLGLLNSNFLSLYAATNPWDDFADSLAYHVLLQSEGSSYRIDLRQGGIVLDIKARLQSSAFASKRQYLENFLQRTDLKYP